MKPIYGYLLLTGACAVISPLAQGQLPSESMNTREDLVNSLTPGKPHIGKEKTEQVDPQKLPSKSVKDVKFEGTLLDVGLGSASDPDLRLEKPRSAGESDSKAPKQSDAVSDKEKSLKAGNTSGDKQKVSKSTESASEGQNKEQKSTSSKSEKQPDKEKAADPAANH